MLCYAEQLVCHVAIHRLPRSFTAGEAITVSTLLTLTLVNFVITLPRHLCSSLSSLFSTVCPSWLLQSLLPAPLFSLPAEARIFWISHSGIAAVLISGILLRPSFSAAAR